MQIILYTHTIYTHINYKNSTETLRIYKRQFNLMRIVNRRDRNAPQATINLCEETLCASHLRLSKYVCQMDFVHKDYRSMEGGTRPFKITAFIKNNLFCLQNNLKKIFTYLYKTHTESAHLRKLIHCLKAMVHRLSQKLSKLLIIENFQTAATGDFADCGGMEPMMVVAVPTLHKNTAVTKAFSIHFPTNIIEMNT